MFDFLKEKKENIGLPVFNFPPPPPSKKEFTTMRQLISDAEKYDSNEEYGVAEDILKDLINYIQKKIYKFMIPHFEIIQGTEEWHRIRWGKIGGTSSKGLFVKSDTLLDEILSQHLEEFELDEDPFSNSAMDRGNDQEPYARKQLELYTGLKFLECGWLQSEENKLLGMSPDGITEDLKIQIEIKCPGRKKHTTTIRENILPLDHLHQCVHAFTVNPLLERLIFGSFRYESIKPLFVKEIGLESLVNLGTKAKPLIKKVSEWVIIAKQEEKSLQAKLDAEIERLKGI